MECRGLTLDRNQNWHVVGRAFDRFFNLGEHAELTEQFDWDKFDCYTKEDGSLITLYSHGIHGWKVNTRGSFADAECNFSGKTWSELVWELIPDEEPEGCPLNLCHAYTYIFELWTPFNKVVRDYGTSQLILIGVRDNLTGEDLKGKDVDIIAESYGFKRPIKFQFSSLTSIEKFLEEQETHDPSFEGVVCRDRNGLRIKIKSKTYVALHRMCDNGNMYNPKNLVPFVLSGETDELLTYFPEAEPALRDVEAKLKEEFDNLMQIFYESRSIVEQKKFAIYITQKRETKFTGMLFTLKKIFGNCA
jgi:T4 RnlA family RNA ligase